MKYYKSIVLIVLLIIISIPLLSKIPTIKEDHKFYKKNLLALRVTGSSESDKQREHEKRIAKDKENLAIKIAKDKEKLEIELADKRNKTILIIAGVVVITALILNRKKKQ